MDFSRRHVRFGWSSVLLFATFGLLLEALQGFKARGYVDASNETRRLMWTLAHAHGTLLGLIHVVFGLTLRDLSELSDATIRRTSAALIAASVLLPGGFFLGGVTFYSGDPGIGIALVPAGAVLLIGALFSIARASGSAKTAPSRSEGKRVRH